MKGIPPQLIALFCIMFIALGIFNILMARRRQQSEGLSSIRTPWYKQIGILTGIEYILLASIFLLNLGISYKLLPSSLNGIVLPFFLILVLASALLAGFVIFTNMQRRRNRVTRGVQVSTNGNTRLASRATESIVDDMPVEEREVYMQKRRERRQKAASARRRKAGRA